MQDDSFKDQKRAFFAKFVLSHRMEMHQLQKGGILGLGKESRGWRNVAEHCILAAVMASTLGRLVGLSQNELTQLVHVALIHDWDKRKSKEATLKSQAVSSSGLVQIESYSDRLIQSEATKHGWLRVTGNDWRDIDQWELPEKILRFVDSSIGQTDDGKTDIINWQSRIDNLAERYPQINQKVGDKLYGGKPLYKKLAEVTVRIEADLYALITSRHPKLKEKYSEQSMLKELVRDTIYVDIAQTTSVPTDLDS